jgi:uncharacterized protein YkwD
MLRSLLAVGAVLVLLLPGTALADLTGREAALLREMNRVRAQHGLPPLHFDARLEAAARSHTQRMLKLNVFTHGAFGNRMLAFNVRGTLAGENLAWGNGLRGTARAIVGAWLASPEHRANLLRPVFKRVGVGELTGIFQGAVGARVVTADFAG